MAVPRDVAAIVDAAQMRGGGQIGVDRLQITNQGLIDADGTGGGAALGEFSKPVERCSSVL